MDRYAYGCASTLHKSVENLNCYDYGRLHNGGPNGCAEASTLAYVRAMKEKCGIVKNFINFAAEAPDYLP